MAGFIVVGFGIAVLVFSPRLIALSKSNKNARWAPASSHTFGVIGIGVVLILMGITMVIL